MAVMADFHSRLPRFAEGLTGAKKVRFRLIWIVVLATVVMIGLSTLSLRGHGAYKLSPWTPTEEDAIVAPSQTKTEDGLKVWDPPEMDPLVHGTYVSEGLKKKPPYALDPFPASPMLHPEEGSNDPKPWLGVAICSAWDIKRRMLIRYTWMQMYKKVPMDQRFVISNPGPVWMEMIRQENRTYGDLIVLDHLPENDFTANTVKTVELYRWLVDVSPKKYQFVTKLDTDLFVNARGFYDAHIKPLLSSKGKNGELTSTVEFTTIGTFYYDDFHKTAFVHGAIYTVSWDIVELLPRLQDQFHVVAGEDITMAWLLMKARQKVNFITLNSTEKYDFDTWDMRSPEDPWARPGSKSESRLHAVEGEHDLAIHNLKKDEDWLRVATCFDKDGVKRKPVNITGTPYEEGDKKPGYPKMRFNYIPEDFWEKGPDGRWLINGIWKLQPGVGKYMATEES